MAKKKKEKLWQDLSAKDVIKLLKKGINVLAKKVEEKTK